MPAERGLRIAVTGSAGTGKTTLVRALSAASDLPVIGEEMRAYLLSGGARLAVLEPARAAGVLAGLWKARQEAEQDHAAAGFIADNCSVDFAAYALQHGCADESGSLIDEACAAASRYDAIFVLPFGAVPYERDGLRTESQGDERRYQLVLEALLARCVGAGRVHRVAPALASVEDRARFCWARIDFERRLRSTGFVSLVGAGPGDPGLLTARAVELLSRADVVAHDALISEEVLARIPRMAERISVGRRRGAPHDAKGMHPAVLEHARRGRHVVRLKQGDPFVFGRGGEEAEELVRAGIPFEVVPGVTSALGACAYAGIPVTHRDHASSVAFITGHQVAQGAREGTLVFFMAGHNLRENLSRLIAEGRDPSTPAAYIAGGTMPCQQVVTGTIGDLPDLVAGLDLEGPPALVVVGDVVRLRERISWFQGAQGVRP